MQPKNKKSPFTHLQVVSNLYEFLSCVEHMEDILKNGQNQTVASPIV